MLERCRGMGFNPKMGWNPTIAIFRDRIFYIVNLAISRELLALDYVRNLLEKEVLRGSNFWFLGGTGGICTIWF